MVFGHKDAYLGAQITTKGELPEAASARKEPESEPGVSSEHFALWMYWLELGMTVLCWEKILCLGLKWFI